MSRKGTVEASLSAEDLHAFCEKLAGIPNLTLRRMQSEAEKLGFKNIVIPKNNDKGLDLSRYSINIVQVGGVEEAFRFLFG